jgi:hypothetical protein
MTGKENSRNAFVPLTLCVTGGPCAGETIAKTVRGAVNCPGCIVWCAGQVYVRQLRVGASQPAPDAPTHVMGWWGLLADEEVHGGPDQDHRDMSQRRRGVAAACGAVVERRWGLERH